MVKGSSPVPLALVAGPPALLDDRAALAAEPVARPLGARAGGLVLVLARGGA